MNSPTNESLVRDANDPLINLLNRIVVLVVKGLAVLITLVIAWGLVDVVIHLYEQVITTPASLFNVENMIATLGVFLAQLIAIEIFLNIVFYLKRDAVHVPLVLATALTAVARKVIILDYTKVVPEYLYGTAGVIIALGVTYWLITRRGE